MFSVTRCSKILTAFSARQNFLELTRADESNPSLRILYGVRTICILCIIMDHRFGTFLSSALLNFDYVETVSFHDNFLCKYIIICMVFIIYYYLDGYYNE